MSRCTDIPFSYHTASLHCLEPFFVSHYASTVAISISLERLTLSWHRTIRNLDAWEGPSTEDSAHIGANPSYDSSLL